MQNKLFDRAVKVIPGGVNSPVRSFNGVGKQSVFIDYANGSWLFGVDGKKYLDYIGSWGPMIFGHAWPPLVEALQKQIALSTSIGLATEKEVEFAELLVSMVPGVEKVRLVNSGTEACMTAVRIARGVTGKQKIIKFNGCYHGHADTFLVKAGSGALTLGKPSSEGVLPETTKNTLVTFGKIIGGGIPVGAVAGKSRWMDCLAPVGPVYQAGTLSGNPLATTAGITMLSALKNNSDVYQSLENKGKQLENGLSEVFHRAGFSVQINRVESMISIFFNEERVETFADVQKSDMDLFSAFFHQMLENGVHLPPSGYESWFLATSLSADLIDFTIDAAEKSLKKITT